MKNDRELKYKKECRWVEREECSEAEVVIIEDKTFSKHAGDASDMLIEENLPFKHDGGVTTVIIDDISNPNHTRIETETPRQSKIPCNKTSKRTEIPSHQDLVPFVAMQSETLDSMVPIEDELPRH
ncbi:hypothetical protein ACH5RR_012714 [Cinchona calisaya]|uniref:Uncharacterized protein n=1 Tax=Cinchona calisaya TaxID=153742 RepID=A0ABD3A931_9GENT